MNLLPRILPLLAALCFFKSAVLAHDGLDLAPPIAVPEAWNVLTLCQANVDKLVAEKQWNEIPIQMFLSAGAIQFLQQNIPPGPNAEDLRGKLKSLRAAADSLLDASNGSDALATPARAAAYDAALRDTAGAYDPKIVNAKVYSCPMCKGIRELDPAAKCFKCNMRLEPRIIPATGTPGEPSITLTPVTTAPLKVGERAEVRIRFAWKRDGKPVSLDDLLVVHTEPIHLLIIDESLDDYHHEHPRPTEVPGEFAFAFTPRQPGSYRVFADVVPRLSQAQEYPVCDLPGSAPGRPVANRADTLSSSGDGLRYDLKWLTGGGPVKVQRPVSGIVAIADADGKPFKQLEPIMGTYAHIVGFYEDRRTVIHIHPMDAEPQRPTDRGGPSFIFRFHAPRPGYLRLYSQIQVGGISRFAPFGLNITQ